MRKETHFHNYIDRFYNNILIPNPKKVLMVLFLIISILGYYATKLEIDASAETLLLEDDSDLQFSRQISKDYYSPNMLVITYSPKDDMLSDTTISDIQTLSNELTNLPLVESVLSILNVPLLQSPPKPIKELLKEIPTLMSKGVDRKLVKNELLTSPVYSNNLIAKDFKTTALVVNLAYDKRFDELLNKRNELLALKKSAKFSSNDEIKLEKAQKEFKTYRDISREETHQNIAQIRQILTTHSHNAKLHLGGVSMVADDMVEFVKADLSTFGIAVFGLLIIILWVIFREIRWIYIPIIISTVSVIATSGLLGMFSWEVTVISSNFISLQLIITMSLVIHLSVKYRELVSTHTNWTQDKIVFHTVKSMIEPSFFVIITTIAGFSSLIFSQILPIINFGWMMSAGVAISLIITFILFPTLLLLLPKSSFSAPSKQFSLTDTLAHISFHHQKLVIFITVVIVVFSLTGAKRLYVENSFIDYFKTDTEIYQGMKTIDESLGGTTPLDVIITFKDDEDSDEVSNIQIQDSEEEEELDDFEDEFEIDTSEKQYWFTKAKIDRIRQIHNYLDGLKATGKVLSLATIDEVGKIANGGKELGSLEWALLYQELPENFKKILLSPYVNVEKNQARIAIRIIDSQKDLRRNELIKKINYDLSKMLDHKYEEFRQSNLLILYNNMLQSLFSSQIKTLGAVLIVIFLMFLLLFRHFKLALIAIIANTTPVSVIFGFMGWGHIPLDMMTITIAAISIGIAVDNTIHYIHRYRFEFEKTKDYELSLYNAHSSIGNAMYYTAVTIMIGFSVLMMSSFMPTIYFGMLTLIAMFMAILADLILLPVLLVMMKPFKVGK